MSKKHPKVLKPNPFRCAWCGENVNRFKAVQGKRGPEDIWLHIACNNALGMIQNELRMVWRRLEALEVKTGLVEAPAQPAEQPAAPEAQEPAQEKASAVGEAAAQ